ncbi:MAG: ABC transporter permease [Peptococcaceae bacterium]|nr:ABC transporter permease [Peptococcaceae bacterium]
MVKLAWSSIRHRLSRTLITVFAMAIAAAVITSGMSLSKGIAKMAYHEYRTYYRGDIVILTPTYVGATAVYDLESTISHNVLNDSGFNPLLKLYPQFGIDGYLGYDLYPYSPLAFEQLQRLRDFPGIRSVDPVLIMPASLGTMATSLRVISSAVGEHLAEGTMPRENSGGESMLEVVVNAYGGPQLSVGDVVTIRVPVFKIGASGVPYADTSATVQERPAKVVGLVRWPTRELSFFPPGGGDPRYEQGYVHSSEVYLTELAWQEIWQQQSAGLTYPVLATTLRVDNLSTLNVTAAELRAAFPELAIKTVPEVARHVERYNILDRFYLIPSALWMNAEQVVAHDYVPVELGLTSAMLLFANAGMLLASQMLASVAERRKEIGIIKALGARNFEILGMVLIEGLLLAITGSIVGFSLVRILAIHRDISNNLSWLIVMQSSLRELAAVVSLTTVVALVFSVIPAAKMSQLTVMEVFRND